MNTKEKIKVMQAFEDGEAVEYQSKGNAMWSMATSPNWDWAGYVFRIKPKKKVRKYLYAYEDDGDWKISKHFYLDVSAFNEKNPEIEYYKRIDSIFIEVDDV